MEESEGEKGQLITQWHTLMKKGTDFDLWGQPVEANETYQRLTVNMREETKFESQLFSDDERKVLNKVVACLELRSKTLQNPGRIEGISLEDLKSIANKLRSLLCSESKDFPVDVAGLQQRSRGRETQGPSLNNSIKSKALDDMGDEESMDAIAQRKFAGTLLPAPASVQGQTLVTVRVDKIGLKDATQYLDSFISVSVKDGQGAVLCSSQDTPVTVHKEDTSVFFGVDVHLQKTLEQLPDDMAIFFEFKHYKPKKKQISTKCWSFMEKDEIKEGQTVIELYKKPTDYKRKKINLLTVKPLYLHLKVTFNS